MLRCHHRTPIRQCRRLIVLCVKKRGSKAKVPHSTSRPETNKPAKESAPRIATDSTYSLKQQLRFVRNIKRWEQRQSAKPATRSKFRKAKTKEAEVQPKAATKGPEVKGHASNDLVQEEYVLSQGKGISSLYDTKTQGNPPAILVDGYNLLMQWIRQPGDNARKRLIAHDFQAARDLILRDFSDFSGWRKLRMMVAFDAQGNANAPPISRDQVGGVEIVFIGYAEADSFIIGEAQQLRRSGCPYVLVASSDNDIQDACWVNEIVPISAMQLLGEMKKAKKEMNAYFTEERRRIASGRLASKVAKANPGLYEKLEQVRTRAAKTL